MSSNDGGPSIMFVILLLVVAFLLCSHSGNDNAANNTTANNTTYPPVHLNVSVNESGTVYWDGNGSATFIPDALGNNTTGR